MFLSSSNSPFLFLQDRRDSYPRFELLLLLSHFQVKKWYIIFFFSQLEHGSSSSIRNASRNFPSDKRIEIYTLKRGYKNRKHSRRLLNSPANGNVVSQNVELDLAVTVQVGFCDKQERDWGKRMFER